jgi:hypothetical protein
MRFKMVHGEPERKRDEVFEACLKTSSQNLPEGDMENHSKLH